MIFEFPAIEVTHNQEHIRSLKPPFDLPWSFIHIPWDFLCLNFSGAASDNMTADIVAYLVASILVVVLIIVVVQVRGAGRAGN